MPFKNFPSPHVHVDSLDSASTPEAFAKKEIELGTGALTVTDHGTLQATRKVYDLCHGKKYKGKLTPILGLEGYFRDDNCPIFEAANVPRTYTWTDPKTDKNYDAEEYKALAAKDAEAYARCVRDAGTYKGFFKYGHITVHFCDEDAFKAGSRILSRCDFKAERHGSERKPIFNWADLEELCSHNVTISSGCLIGMVQRHIMAHGRFDLAEKYYDRLRSIVRPGNFYVEVFPHVCDRDWDASVTVKFEDGTEERFAVWKKLKTDKAPKGDKDGWKARDLADAWRRSQEGHGCLRAKMEDRKWVEYETPKKIVSVEAHEGFIVNECQPWAPGGDLQFGCNKAVMELAAKYGDKILISDDSHFVAPDEKIVQDIRLQQNGSWRFANAHFRFSSDNAWEYFDKVLQIPQAQFEEWIDNSYGWAEKFKGFKFGERRSLPVNFYPENTLKHTLQLIKRHGRMLNTPEYWGRLKEEFDLLHYNGTIDLLPYFFIDEEVCRLYARHGLITGPGRGSAAGLLLTYLLGITHADPLRYGLSKDRFITLDRIQSKKLPDIDQDLPNRDLLVDPEAGWLKKRFGDCYAQISVDTTLKLRSAVKDVARWKRAVDGKGGFVPPEIEALTSKFMMPPQGISDSDFVFGYKREGEDTWEKGSIEYDPALQEYIRQFPEEWEQVKRCLGLSRQKGRHACAYVIADEPIANFIPLTSVSDVRVTQFTAPSVEAAGGLKMDFLVINSLNDINNAVRLIQDRHGGKEFDWADSRRQRDEGDEIPSMKIDGRSVPLIRAVPFNGRFFDIWDLPEDQAVFRQICEGRTETVFQFNTPGARKWLRNFDAIRYTDENGVVHKALDSIEALAAFTALDRPGPLDYYVEAPDGSKHNMLVEYANRAKGRDSVGSFPILDQLFPESYGVIVYQEQLQRAFQEIGKTTAIEANNFRIHVSKKQMKEVQADKLIFMKGAVETVGQEAAEQLWQSMETFGQYGFNKSHSVCYVIISYACAWLKHNYPLEWWTAVLANATKNEIDEVFWPYCGHLIKMPDINLSGPNFQIEGDGIRAPLSLLQGIGPTAQAELAAGRPYKDVEDLCQKILAKKVAGPDGKKGRSALHRGIIYKLICSGVMDSLFPLGNEAPEQLGLFEQAAAKVNGKKRPEAVDLFYTNLKPLQRYQLRKSILTAYGEDLRPIFRDIAVPGVMKVKGGYDFSYKPENRNFEDRVPLVNAKTAEAIQGAMILPDGGIRWAVAAYVLSDERQTYHGSKKMAKLFLDVQGRRQEFVKWPNKEGTLPKKFKDQNFAGALVIAIISRYKEDRPPVLDDLFVVQAPLVKEKEENVKA